MKSERVNYWFLENPQGEWLVSYTDGRGLPIVTKDHTRAWRFSSKREADECRNRVLGFAWQDEFWPTEHADEPAPKVKGERAVPKSRWLAIVTYLADVGQVGVEHDIEELEDLRDLVECGPDWNTIIDIRITLQDRSDLVGLTIEQVERQEPKDEG